MSISNRFGSSEIFDRLTENQRIRFLFSPSFGPVWITVFLLFPLTIIIGLSFAVSGDFGNVIYEFTLENYRRFLSAEIYLNIIVRSLKIGFIITALTLPLGYAVAYFIARSATRFTGVLLGLVVLQYWVPFIIRTYAWIIMLSNSGLVNQFLLLIGLFDKPVRILYTTNGMIIGLGAALLPFMILPIYVSISQIEDDQLHAAKTLGATDIRAFLEVTFPLSLPGVVSGVLFVFIISAGSFLAPELLGNSANRMIAPVIADIFLRDYNWPFAATLSVIYFAFIAVLVYLFTRSIGIEKALGGRQT